MRSGWASLRVLLVLTAALILSCRGIDYSQGAHACITTAAPPATDIGQKVLDNGGNAFDAAVAVGFALAVVHPEAGNLGGGGFAVIYDADESRVEALDFRETAPQAAHETMYLDSDGNVIEGASTLGALACGVPGTVAGLYELWRRHGSMPWDSLVGPIADLAENGFVVDDGLALRFAENEAGLRTFAETEAIYLPKGSLLGSGDTLYQPDLAATLRLIAHEGPPGFYAGLTAERIVATMAAHGGLISADDLAQYRPVWRLPLRFEYDSLTVYSMPLPSSGGTCLAQILSFLEPYDIDHLTADDPRYIHLFAEAARLSFADRADWLGDPEYVDVPNLLEPGYLDRRRALIDDSLATPSQEVGSGYQPTEESDQTTHFCIVDAAGNAVSLTYTLNTAFGSKLVVDGAGFLLNNEMDDFSIKPGHPNVYGLVGGTANRIEPGKRMLSSMSPTIVMRGDRPKLVVGTPGGSKIITAVAQAVIDITQFGMDPAAVVAQPRFHHQWLPDVLYLEEGGFDINVTQDLLRRGHVVKERSAYGDLNLIEISEQGLCIGAVDPRGRGSTSRGGFYVQVSE